MVSGKDYEILETNLQPFFWRKVKNTIQQNKKAALQEFLFGYDNGKGISYTSSSLHLQEMQDKIQNFQNRVDSLFTSLIGRIISDCERSEQTLSLPSTKTNSIRA